jgi:hypothetical protein
MSSSGLRNLAVRLWLDRMDQIRELDGILNEEDWDVVSNQIWSKSAQLCYNCGTMVAFVYSPKLPSSV